MRGAVRQIVHQHRRSLVAALLATVGLIAALWLTVFVADDTSTAPTDAATLLAGLPHGEAVRAGKSGAVAASSSPLAGRYQLTYSMTMSAPTAHGQASGEMALKAELQVAAAAQPGWYVGRLLQPKVTADPQLASAMGASVAEPGAGFEVPFALKLDEDGAITAMRHGAEAPSGVRHLLSGLLRALQVVRTREDVDHAGWTLTEPGPDGDREVSYQTKGDALQKDWRVSQLGKGDAKRAPMEAVGAVHMQLAGGTIRDATYALTVDADLGMGLGEARYKGTVNAALKRLGVASAAWAQQLDLDSLEAGLGAKRVHAPRPRIAVAEGATVASLVHAASSAAVQRDRGVRRSAMQQLATLIQRDPSRARQVADLIRSPQPGVERRTLVEALASSNTAAAKAEMSALIEDTDLDPESRADVATVTTFMTQPGAPLIASLTKQLGDAGYSRLGTASLWALAGQARQQADRDAALAASLSTKLRGQAAATLGPAAALLPTKPPESAGLAKFGAFKAEALKAGATTLAPVATGQGADVGDLGASGGGTVGPTGLGGTPPPSPGALATRGQIDAWLEALGTIGGPEVLPLIRPWLNHPYHQVRMTAVFALRFVQTSAARIEIVNRMALDPDGWVRRSAVMAARYHPVAPFLAPVSRALKEDMHPNVRLAAAYNLAVWAHEAPPLMALVRTAAQREPKPLVARAMRDLEPMLLRDAPDGTVTMEPVLLGGKHIDSVPSGVALVPRQAPKSAATEEGALPSGDGQ